MDTPEIQGTILGLGWVYGVLIYCQAENFDGKESESKIWNPNLRRKSRRRKRTSRGHLPEILKSTTLQRMNFQRLRPQAMLTPTECFRFHMRLHFSSTGWPKKSKTLSLKACQLYLSILVIRNLEFRETWEQSWSNEFSPIPSMQNLVCFINVIQGKCSKDWILPNQMWRWSVGVCFKKSTSHGESSPAGLPNT